MPEDVTDEMLLGARLVTQTALRPKKDKYAERNRLQAIEQAKRTFCRRCERTEAQMAYLDPGRLAEIEAYFEVVYGRGASTEELKALVDGVGDILLRAAFWSDKLDSYIEDKRSTREALIYETNHSRRRRLRELLATPRWVDVTEIAKLVLLRNKMTRETGIPHHIDHIFPLAAKLVCGLHVHFNMRVVPAKENLSKGHRMTHEMLDKAAEEMQTA